MAQAVSYPRLTVKAPVQSQASSCGVLVGNVALG
jgi:hypothetical protein